MAGASLQVVKQHLCRRQGGPELSWCVSWVLPGQGQSQWPVGLHVLSAHVSEATLGPPGSCAPSRGSVVRGA